MIRRMPFLYSEWEYPGSFKGGTEPIVKKEKKPTSSKILLYIAIFLAGVIVGLYLFSKISTKSEINQFPEVIGYGFKSIITSNPFLDTTDFSNWYDNGATYNHVSDFRGRFGVSFVHPLSVSEITFIEHDIYLSPGYRYLLRASVANVAGWVKEIESNCLCADSIIRIKVIDPSTGEEKTYFNGVVNSRNDWLDLTFDISDFAGKTITFRAEGVAGGPCGNWCDEWGAFDYFFVEQLQ